MLLSWEMVTDDVELMGHGLFSIAFPVSGQGSVLWLIHPANICSKSRPGYTHMLDSKMSIIDEHNIRKWAISLKNLVEEYYKYISSLNKK